MVTLAWIILFAPIGAAAGILLTARNSKRRSAALGVGALALSFLSTAAVFLHSLRQEAGTLLETSVRWIHLPGLSIEFGLLLDPLAILMSLVVTGVGLTIFIYSIGYMREDPGFSRYFAFLSLFAFSMLGIVLANNFITLFIFWELVGASSYLLIGYWYARPQAADAGKKAFLVNRIADFGFLLGILMLWSFSGSGGEARTLNFPELARRLENFSAQGGFASHTVALIGAFLFCGVVGKSAQFPLHVWLPDAMEGPTPVSALIHAATMVAAGVYLLCRVFFLLWAAPQLLTLIAAVGGFTGLFAATLALVENDIKRILAYSTLSQLGMMVMALGLGGVAPGMFHLTTHAFFKAMLFMGAGCVIHALHTNDIRQMGGLARSMPVTTIIFLIGSLALAGIFPLAGFFSKDEILALAFDRSKLLWLVGTITAGMTAFYMGRLFCVAFLGEPRSREAHAQSAEAPGEASTSRSQSAEAPPIMTLSLIPLAILSAVGGFVGIPHFLHDSPGIHPEFNLTVAALSTLAAVAGLWLSFLVYGKRLEPAPSLKGTFDWIYPVLARKYYVDDLYGWINRNIQQRTAVALSIFERIVIIGLWANGIAKTTGVAGGILRRAQTGKVQTYALAFLAGLGLILYFSIHGF